MDKSLVLASYATVLMSKIGQSLVEVGFTTGGVSITPSRDIAEIRADQSKYPLWLLTTGRGMEVNFRLMEITTDNFKMGWGEPGLTTDLVDELSLGAPEDLPERYHIKIYAKRMDNKYVIFEFHDAISAAPGAFPIRQGEAAVIETTLRCTYDDTNNRIGVVKMSDTV